VIEAPVGVTWSGSFLNTYAPSHDSERCMTTRCHTLALARSLVECEQVLMITGVELAIAAATTNPGVEDTYHVLALEHQRLGSLVHLGLQIVDRSKTKDKRRTAKGRAAFRHSSFVLRPHGVAFQIGAILIERGIGLSRPHR